MGITGAVMASLFSYITITIWMFYDLFLKKGDVKLSLRNYSIKLPIIKKLLNIGFPSMLNYAFLYLGFFLINKEMEKFGAIALNAHKELLRILMPSALSCHLQLELQFLQ